MGLFTNTAERIDRRRGWDHLPLPLAMLVLIGLRNRLRQKNLYDTGRGPLDKPDVNDHPRHLTARTLDGTFNDLDDPLMGSLGSRFGRNVPLEYTVREPDGQAARAEPAHDQPRAPDAEGVHSGDDAQPARRRVDPVRGARLVQPRQERSGEPVGRAASRTTTPGPSTRCRSRRRGPTRAPIRPARRPSSPTTRTGGTARRSTAATPRSPTRCARASTASCGSTSTACRRRTSRRTSIPSGVAGNFWVGLALLHSLFMREHNAICDHLHEKHPELSDDELYDKARLVVAALMAKIHTDRLDAGDHRAPDDGDGAADELVGARGRAARQALRPHARTNEVIRGIPGSPTNHHGVPYSLTEEFVCVYRMHPLIPDEFSFRRLADDAHAPGADAAGDRRAARARAARRDVDERRALLVRDVASRRDHAAQLPALPPALRPPGRLADRPRLDRRPARARARRAALQRVPPAAPPQAVRHVRGDGRHAGARRGAARDLRRRRARRHDDRHVRGAEAEGLRLQRHRVPHLHPDGVAAARERPLLHARLPARGLHARRASTGSRATPCARCSCATSPSSSRRSRESRIRSRPGSARRRDRARARHPQRSATARAATCTRS